MTLKTTAKLSVLYIYISQILIPTLEEKWEKVMYKVNLSFYLLCTNKPWVHLPFPFVLILHYHFQFLGWSITALAHGIEIL